MEFNDRINTISEYHFKKLDAIRKEFRSSGRNLVDLSIGDPDLPTDKSILDALIKGFEVKDFNKYPPYDGIEELKRGIIDYYYRFFSVKLTLDEVIILIGSKEGINNLIPAVCGIGDFAIIPNPAYPVYETCCHLWGVNTFNVALEERNSYLARLEHVPNDIAQKSRLFIINYPNNPTGAVATPEFYREIIDFCYKNDIVLCNDGAYNEITSGNEKPKSILQYDKKKCCIEFGTFSKIYNMTGFRIGYAVGNSKIIQALLKVKSNVDSGQFIPIQYAAIQALNLNEDYANNIRKVYTERRVSAEKLLKKHNIEFFTGSGTFYIWCRTPKNYSTQSFCEEILNEYGIVVTPGIAFGSGGKEYFRIALTTDKSNIVNALIKLKIY